MAVGLEEVEMDDKGPIPWHWRGIWGSPIPNVYAPSEVANGIIRFDLPSQS
jgi:hypothetical protein